jgi:hypothetical protein
VGWHSALDKRGLFKQPLNIFVVLGGRSGSNKSGIYRLILDSAKRLAEEKLFSRLGLLPKDLPQQTAIRGSTISDSMEDSPEAKGKSKEKSKDKTKRNLATFCLDGESVFICTSHLLRLDVCFVFCADCSERNLLAKRPTTVTIVT